MTSRENKSHHPRLDVLPHPPALAGTSPREIEVRIEELILHGFTPGTRWQVADALESELHVLLAERGVPAAWKNSPEKLTADAIRATNETRPAVAGEQIARSVYQGEAI